MDQLYCAQPDPTYCLSSKCFRACGMMDIYTSKVLASNSRIARKFIWGFSDYSTDASVEDWYRFSIS